MGEVSGCHDDSDAAKEEIACSLAHCSFVVVFTTWLEVRSICLVLSQYIRLIHIHYVFRCFLHSQSMRPAQCVGLVTYAFWNYYNLSLIQQILERNIRLELVLTAQIKAMKTNALVFKRKKWDYLD